MCLNIFFFQFWMFTKLWRIVLDGSSPIIPSRKTFSSVNGKFRAKKKKRKYVRIILPFSILHRTVASPRESLAVGGKRLPSISDQQQQQQQQQLPWEECSQFDSTKLHCNLFWILWFPPAVKTHFHSRKFSTDRNFSENIIVKSQLQNFFPTENLCRPITFYKIFLSAENFPEWKLALTLDHWRSCREGLRLEGGVFIKQLR